MTPEEAYARKCKTCGAGTNFAHPYCSVGCAAKEIAALEERNRALEQGLAERDADIRGYFGIRDRANERITELESTVQTLTLQLTEAKFEEQFALKLKDIGIDARLLDSYREQKMKIRELESTVQAQAAEIAKLSLGRRRTSRNASLR